MAYSYYIAFKKFQKSEVLLLLIDLLTPAEDNPEVYTQDV
jgi:hypothetical protein